MHERVQRTLVREQVLILGELERSVHCFCLMNCFANLVLSWVSERHFLSFNFRSFQTKFVAEKPFIQHRLIFLIIRSLVHALPTAFLWVIPQQIRNVKKPRLLVFVAAGSIKTRVQQVSCSNNSATEPSKTLLQHNTKSPTACWCCCLIKHNVRRKSLIIVSYLCAFIIISR